MQDGNLLAGGVKPSRSSARWGEWYGWPEESAIPWTEKAADEG